MEKTMGIIAVWLETIANELDRLNDLLEERL